MRSLVSFVLALLPLLSLAAPTQESQFQCGNEYIPIPESLRQAHRDASVREGRRDGDARDGAASGTNTRRQSASKIIVPTYFHIVTTRAKQPTYNSTILSKQPAALNSGFASTTFQFSLAGADITTYDPWATLDIDANPSGVQAMKDRLRKGTYSALNVYYLSDLAGGLLGVCSLPSTGVDASTPPSSYSFDGCIVHAGSMPGGPDFRGRYDLGYTAVHEVGHWFGLFHVFQGNSCAQDGDGISDTPLQQTPTGGCPVRKDSCPNAPGLDAIDNFMDYSDDRCLTQFTPGQSSRMQQLWPSLRQGR